MKVRLEQMNALLQQEQIANKARSEAGGFGALLAQELGQAEGSAQGVLPQAPGAAQAEVINRLLLGSIEQTEAATSVDPLDGILQQSFTQLSGLLDSFDAYAQALSAAGNEGGLKNAYSLLAGLETQMHSLQQGAVPLAGKHAGLDSLVNELEIMTITEKFKFNRGDYM